MTRHTTLSTRTLALALVALTVLIAALAVPASAAPSDSVGPIQSDSDADSADDGLTFDEIRYSIEHWLESTQSAGSGMIDRIEYEANAANPWGDGHDVAAEANESIVAVNDNNDEIATYLDNHTLASNAETDADQIHEIKLVDDRSGDTESFYIELEYDETNSEIASIEATQSITGSYAVDEQHRASGLLAQNFASEIEIFVEEFAITEREIVDDPRYIPRLASQYGGLSEHYFQSTLMDDDFDGFEDSNNDTGSGGD